MGKYLEKNSRKSLKHGAYSATTIAPLQRRIRKKLMQLSYLQDQDYFLVNMFSRELAIQQLIVEYIREKGIFEDDNGKLHSVFNKYWCSVNCSARLADQLGLSPTARARLGVDIARQWDFAKAMQEVKEK